MKHQGEGLLCFCIVVSVITIPAIVDLLVKIEQLIAAY